MLHPYCLEAWNRLKKTLLVFLVLKRFIVREPEIAQRIYKLITGGRSLKADGKIPWAFNLTQAAAGAFDFATSIFYRFFWQMS